MTYEAKYLAVANAAVWLTIMVVSFVVGVNREWWLVVLPSLAVGSHLLIVVTFCEGSCRSDDSRQKKRSRLSGMSPALNLKSGLSLKKVLLNVVARITLSR